jgi:hypothetical protein
MAFPPPSPNWFVSLRKMYDALGVISYFCSSAIGAACPGAISAVLVTAIERFHRVSDLDFGCIGVPFEAKFLDDAPTPGTFEGYGAVFGNMDYHRDVIEPGAFAKSLLQREREGRKLPPMFSNHGLANGRDPIGVWEKMSEDATGLYVKGGSSGSTPSAASI